MYINKCFYLGELSNSLPEIPSSPEERINLTHIETSQITVEDGLLTLEVPSNYYSNNESSVAGNTPTFKTANFGKYL